MTTIFFTRHGETEWNTQRRMQGWLDSPLTEKGKLQAVYLGERMKAISLATIYSSDAPRATTTADLIRGGRNIPIVPLKELREMCLGEWEGCFVSELFERESVNCQNLMAEAGRASPASEMPATPIIVIAIATPMFFTSVPSPQCACHFRAPVVGFFLEPVDNLA